MKVTKRLITLILIFAIVLSAMSFTAYAAEPETSEPEQIEEELASTYLSISVLGNKISWNIPGPTWAIAISYGITLEVSYMSGSTMYTYVQSITTNNDSHTAPGSLQAAYLYYD